MLDRNTLFAMVVGASVVNGIFSPYLNIAVPIVAVLMPEMFPRSPGWVLFFSSILVASATLLGSGVPAAVHERHIDTDPNAAGPMWTWLIGAMVLTIPALPNIG